MNNDLISREALLKEVRENKELFETERVYLEGLILNAPEVDLVSPTINVNITEETKQKLIEEFQKPHKLLVLPEPEVTFERPQGEWKAFVYDYDMPENEYGDHIRPPKEGEEQHWEEYWAPEYYCSICMAKNHKANFCPNCGAKMKYGGAE